MKPGLRDTAVVLILGTLAGALAACGGPRQSDFPMTLGPSPTAPPPATATPLPPPPKTLIVCLAEEPSSLYLYGDGGPSASRVLEAIYDGPIDLLSYAYQPVILEALPNLGQGSASIQPVTAVSGDIYLNPSTGLPENLKPGKPYVPAGCEQTSCLRTFQGGEVEMDQMQAVFRLLPGILWSDGETVKASDSVFSYKLDGEVATPSFKYLFDRTASYVALDDLSVEWTGIPGFIDPEYQGNFWSPLPEHALVPAERRGDAARSLGRPHAPWAGGPIDWLNGPRAGTSSWSAIRATSGRTKACLPSTDFSSVSSGKGRPLPCSRS